ncbi:hypothetical protein [Clostridium butyricum]|uniref:hypothetical protein n=1 Tax=Clostridium butyricum TaxID=1492 RepID=UPI0011DD5F1A|nr:hypothetical protein [Clostridium butyricum]MBO1687735.1 hypothetical protein [Clostridium butyricum]MDB2140110.1 hypothetical protein [Clostridium butyricum]
MDVMSKFLQAEINSQELYEEIYKFVVSDHIRNGEFEGNEYVIKKMDQDNFILFPEYIDEDGKREINFAISVYKEQLIKEIQNNAIEKGLQVVNEE